jgi:L-asparaginase
LRQDVPRGEIRVILQNLGRESVEIVAGERIAQMVVARYEAVEWKEGDPSGIVRGERGFGSSGRQREVDRIDGMIRTISMCASAALALALMPLLSAQNLPAVVVLATGGTIASRQNITQGTSQPALTGDQLVDAVPALKKIARVRSEQIATVGSRDMTPAIWLKIAVRANELLAQADVAGIVVTHGTDTLEETAWFLDLTIASTKPVVVVASQRPASDTDSDGPRNLLDAVRVAVSPEASGKGVLVVLNGQINAARDVTKTHTSQVETFRSLEFGELGIADSETVRFYRAPLRRQTIPVNATTQLGRVEIVYNYAGADGRLIRALIREEGLAGLVVAGVGLGNVTAGVADAIAEARAKGVPVVIATRVLSGRVFSLGDGKSSAIGLKKIGCVLADNLNPQKSRVLLMLALTKTSEPAEIQKYFDN